MIDRIKVKATKPHLRGHQLAIGGTLYFVHPESMQLHELFNGVPLPEVGVRKAHLPEFAGQASFETSAPVPLPPPVPAAPGKVKGASGGAVTGSPDRTGEPAPSDAFDLKTKESTALAFRTRLLAMDRPALERQADTLAIPHDGLTDEDLVTAIMLAKGFSESEASNTVIVDDPRKRERELNALLKPELQALGEALQVPNALKLGKEKLIAGILHAEAAKV
jgi:hypothetical protein